MIELPPPLLFVEKPAIVRAENLDAIPHWSKVIREARRQLRSERESALAAALAMTFPFPIFSPSNASASRSKLDDSNIQATNAASHTHTAMTLSAGGRTVIGIVIVPNGALGTISSVTANGVAATAIVTAASASERSALYVVSAGAASGDVVITGSTNLYSTTVITWEMLNASATATDTGTDTDSEPATFDLDIAAGGVAFGMVTHRSDSNPTTCTWTNLTEDYDAANDATTNWAYAASAAFASAQTNLTITADASAAGVRNPVLCVASFPPA